MESRYPGMEVNPQSAHSQRRASGRKDMTSQRIRQGAARERRIREPRRQPPRMHEQFELGYNIPRIVSATQFETGGSYPKEAPSSSSTRFRHAEDIDGRMDRGPAPINFTSSQTHIPVAKNSIRWYKLAGSPIGGLPSAGGVFPGFLCIRGGANCASSACS